MWQVPLTVGEDLRVVPEERHALGEWALTITRSEVGGGPNTTHCIPCFFTVTKLTRPGGRVQV